MRNRTLQFLFDYLFQQGEPAGLGRDNHPPNSALDPSSSGSFHTKSLDVNLPCDMPPRLTLLVPNRLDILRNLASHKLK